MNLIRQQRSFLVLGAVVLLVLTAAVVFLSWTGPPEEHALPLESRRAATLGLAGLVVIFVLQVLSQQRRLAAVEDTLRHAELREATLRARFDELEALFGASAELAGKLDLEGMLDLAARRLRRGLEADVCAILLFNRAQNKLLATAVSGDEGGATAHAVVRPGDGVSGLVFSNAEPMVVDAEALLGQLAVEMNLKRTPAAGLCVPLRIRGQAIGVIDLARFEHDEPYGQVHARMLAAFAENLAGTIAKTVQYRGHTREGDAARAA